MGAEGTERPVAVGVDGSESALQAVRWAAREAVRRRVPLRLLAAHHWPMLGDPLLGVDHRDLLRTIAVDHLAAAVRAIPLDGARPRIERVLLEGLPVPALRAASARAGLLVLGGRGAGCLAGLTTGSVVEHVAARAVCPVVVVREPAPGVLPDRDGPVVLGVDGPDTEAAIAFAFDVAARWGVPLVAVQAVGDPLDPLLEAVLPVDEEEQGAVLADRLAAWAEKYPDVPLRRHVVHDRPARALVAWSVGAQLLVVGSRGHEGAAALVAGSVGRAVLHRSRCPVAVVRPTG